MKRKAFRRWLTWVKLNWFRIGVAKQNRAAAVSTLHAKDIR